MLAAASVGGLVLVVVGASAIAMTRPDAVVPASAAPYVESARTIASANAGLVGMLPLRIDEVRCGANAGDFAFAFVNPLGRAYAVVEGGPPAEQTYPPEATIGIGPATAEEFAAFEAGPCE
jgi:hypothetical protein